MWIEMCAFAASDNRYSFTLSIMMGRAATPA